MTIEIEIKFIATPQAAEKLPALLTNWPCQHTAPQKLTNIYFETADKQLRRWDMGLRIRGSGDRYEMTLKTAGQSVGGLHQRPEYNVALEQPALEIAKLPDEVWPQGVDVVALQQQLQPLFSTHFIREKWVVTYRKSQIEVAFDQGEVSADQLSESLNEVELELLSGSRDDLLAFAAELAATDGLRLGSLSKAARGYMLAQGNPPLPLRPTGIMPVPAKATVEEGMYAACTLALNQWQYHEELWLRGNSAALHEVRQALALLRQTFTLFGTLVPRKASSALRQSLARMEEALETQKLDAHTLCHSAPNTQTQLALTHWIATYGWRDFIDDKASARLNSSFKRFSDIMLGRLAADLKETFKVVRQHNEYHDKLTRLHHQLLGVRLLAGTCQADRVDGWLDAWQQLALAIETNNTARLDEYRRQAIKQPAFWKNGNA